MCFRNCFVGILCFLFSSMLYGQFNIQVGYGIGYTPATGINGLISEFNANAPENVLLSEEMPDLHFMHGIVVGTRWKYEFVGVELTWENLSRKREGFGENTITNALFSKEYTFTANNYSVGVESYFSNFGLGASLGLRQTRIKRAIASSDKKTSVVNDNQYNLKTYFIINLGGSDRVRLALKPYVSIPLSDIYLGEKDRYVGFDDDLGVTVENLDESLWFYGLSFVFYNGRFRD